MKQYPVACSLLVGVSLLMGLSDARAQGWQPVYFVSGGMARPVSPKSFSGTRSTGWSAGAAVGLPLSENLLVRLAADYGQIPFSEGVSQDPELPGTDVQVLSAMLDLVFAPTGIRYAVRPYTLAGGGYYRRWVEAYPIVNDAGNTEPGTLTENTFGIVFGAGVDFLLGSGWGVFLEGRYVIGFTDDEPTGHLPLRLGVAFQ